MQTFLKILAVAAVVVIVPLATVPQVQAHDGHFHGGYSGGYWNGGYNFTKPIYHQPSLHFHRVYHPTRLHWTPNRGWHTHGHVDIVPHFTPGHYDTYHNGHIHANPWFHN
jgi:hypothetical protein